MLSKHLKNAIGKDFTLHGDILAICQGDHISALALEVIINETADFIERHRINPGTIPWIELSLRDFESHCLGLASYTSFGDRLKPESLLHQLGFIKSRFIDDDQVLPVMRQLSVNSEAIKAALVALKREDKPRWL